MERKRKLSTSDLSDVRSDKSLMSEKLWDGSLQINSSITVSAVAFFKSGERLLDTSWSKFVEVKGKVRLDAFEKYILDLPRSRTRGLMVISLCAKEGSSEKGLKGLKEVSKAYIEGERVGIAQLSPGVEVYLCPRCDKIFTILETYGFKGMGAAEDKLESLIGCVVWRKNQTAANSVVKEKESKGSLPKQPQKSPSDSSTQNAGGGERGMSSSSMPRQNSISSPVRPFSGVQSMNSNAREVEIGNSSTATIWATPSVAAKSTIAVEQQESGCFNLSSQTTSQGYRLGREAASIRNSESKKTIASLELPNKFISAPSNVVKQKMPTAEEDDDDDLPEYDFGALHGTSCTSASMPLGVPTTDSRLQTERTMNVDGHMLPSLPVGHSSSSSNQRMPVSKVTADHDPRTRVSGRLEDKYDFQKYATPAAVGALHPSSVIPSEELHKRNLFSDYDNMPEWLPTQQQRPLTPGPTRSQFPPQWYSQPNHQSTNCRPPPPLPTQNSASFLTGFGYNRGLRPPSGYPHRPAGGRDWRP